MSSILTVLGFAGNVGVAGEEAGASVGVGPGVFVDAEAGLEGGAGADVVVEVTAGDEDGVEVGVDWQATSVKITINTAPITVNFLRIV